MERERPTDSDQGNVHDRDAEGNLMQAIRKLGNSFNQHSILGPLIITGWAVTLYVSNQPPIVLLARKYTS